MSDARSAVTDTILAAAVRTLAAGGVANVSLRDIAREAGVALSQLHYYFGSRERLIAAAASYLMKKRIAALQEGLAKAGSPAERISLAIRLVRRHVSADPALTRIRLELQTMACWSPELAAEARQLQGELLDVILAEGEQTTAVARLVLGALDGLALQTLQGAPAEEMDAAYAALEGVLMNLLT